MSKRFLESDCASIRIALIATYPELTKSLSELAEKYGIILDNYYASFSEAIIVAKRIENEVDAIVTRGGTGHEIRRAVSTPVVLIPITPFDLCESVHKLPSDVKDVAFVNFERKLYGVRSVEQMFGIRIHELTFLNKNDIERGIRNAKANGIKNIIGGNVAVEYARQEGLTAYEIVSGKEAVYKALQEVVELVKNMRIEKQKSQRFRTAFISISEGIIISDENKQVILCNTAADTIFGAVGDGLQIQNIIEDDHIEKVFEWHKPEQNNLLKINHMVANVSHVPIELEHKFIGVVSTIEDVTKIQNLEGLIRNKLSTKGFYAKYSFDDIITCNEKMQNLKEVAAFYASTESTVLIEGETGTGKELFAQSIHNAGERTKGPFVAVNCAAIPEQLLESELFGYEGGAFTGARKEGKQGLFEMANNGTIFLDEIGEMPKTLQSRLLRVLQEKEVMRVGGAKMIPINVRIISATNKNLLQRTKTEEFREDLYYRLNVFRIKIPALRERKNDIPLLCEKIIEEWKLPISQDGRKFLNETLMPEFMNYSWPGNIRELRNIMERLGFFLQGKAPGDIWSALIEEIVQKEPVNENKIVITDINLDVGLKKAVSKIEKEIIGILLENNNNDLDLVAQKLDIGRTTLWRKMNP